MLGKHVFTIIYTDGIYFQIKNINHSTLASGYSQQSVPVVATYHNQAGKASSLYVDQGQSLFRKEEGWFVSYLLLWLMVHIILVRSWLPPIDPTLSVYEEIKSSQSY